MIGNYILIGTYNLNLNPNLYLPTGIGLRGNLQIHNISMTPPFSHIRPWFIDLKILI